MTGCIYIARNLVNGKAYIGKTERGLSLRRTEHERDASLGSKLVFHCALRKYGAAAFAWEVLFESKNQAVLIRMEAYFIETEETKIRGYNLTNGGEGTAGLKWGPESRAKLAKTATGRRASEETRAKMSRNRKGIRKHTEETKQKQSRALQGLQRPPRSEQHRRNHSEALRGFRHTEVAKLKVSEALKGRKKPRVFAPDGTPLCRGCGVPHLECSPKCNTCRARRIRREKKNE